jgi:hypothetical protein
MDGMLDETGVASQRRIYDAEEGAMQARWERGLHQRRQIIRHHDRPTTDQDIAGAFGLMLWWAGKINALITRRCRAKTPSARAYQAAAAIRDYHRLRMGIAERDIIAADIVVEAISGHLRRPGKIDWTQRTAVLDMLEGASSYETADRFGRDPSSLRERIDSELPGIEAEIDRAMIRV